MRGTVLLRRERGERPEGENERRKLRSGRMSENSKAERLLRENVKQKGYGARMKQRVTERE
jgi:hypothetical protein